MGGRPTDRPDRPTDRPNDRQTGPPTHRPDPTRTDRRLALPLILSQYPSHTDRFSTSIPSCLVSFNFDPRLRKTTVSKHFFLD